MVLQETWKLSETLKVEWTYYQYNKQKIQNEQIKHKYSPCV